MEETCQSEISEIAGAIRSGCRITSKLSRIDTVTYNISEEVGLYINTMQADNNCYIISPVLSIQ